MTALACLTLLVFLSASPAASVSGDGDPLHTIGGDVMEGGIDASASEKVLERAREGQQVKAPKPGERSFEYRSVSSCDTTTRELLGSVACATAMDECAGNTPEQGQGPLAFVYRREVAAKGAAPNRWEMVGTTCFPKPGKSLPAREQARKAFHRTPFALPMVHIQPEGNLTLVTLPTYFEVKWPAAGFQPGEIDATTLLKHGVQIRPTVKGYTYFFGDGTRFGPTRSPGGIYPVGDITHVYAKRGTYDTRIEVTYGGEFSVNGGEYWEPIPGEAKVVGPTQPLAVKTAHARLVGPLRGRP